MTDETMDALEIAPAAVVKRAAHDFAAALAETPQFEAFGLAAEHFQNDQAAQESLRAFQEKQASLRALRMLNALSPEQQAELEALKKGFYGRPTVQEYLAAQSEFAALCQSVGDMLSESIGLNYAAACGVSCCG
jgi:cell fate (sporulation/competence/biofilm development) regulator YlbF (YheA/YmcA/DUF963 family)